MMRLGALVGPAAAGLLLSRLGVAPVFWIDAATYVVSFITIAAMASVPPVQHDRQQGIGDVVHGLRQVRRSPVVAGVFLAELNASVLGSPRALFPALATTTFGGGAMTYGLLNAAPGAGALVTALTMGWAGRLRRQGRAVVIAVAVWGAAISAFGFTQSLPIALAVLAVAGAADVISAVFCNTMLQSSLSNRVRGRMSAILVAVVFGGPRLGDAESAGIAAVAGVQASVVAGGLSCALGIAVLARRNPDFWQYQSGGVVDSPGGADQDLALLGDKYISEPKMTIPGESQEPWSGSTQPT